MSRSDDSGPIRDFLSAYDPQLVPHILGFADRLNALPVGAIVTMARKATCLVDAMIQLGLVHTTSQVTSDRVLDMDIGWIEGRRIALVDDLIVSGTTLHRTVERVVNAGAADVSIHTIVVDADWWSPQLTQPVEPYLKLDDQSSMAFCTQTVQALNFMPRPYNVDWPLFLDWDMPPSDFDRLGALGGWRAYDVTSIGQGLRGVHSITSEATAVSLAQLDERCGWPISRQVELAKVRVFARRLPRAPLRLAMQALPIVTFARMSTTHVDAMWSALLRHHDVPAAVEAQFCSVASRLRLIQYLTATELGRLWLAAVGDTVGTRQAAKASEHQVRYAFPPHIAGHVARFADAGGEFLRSTPIPPAVPNPTVRDHKRELELMATPTTSIAAVQAQLTEPFRQMYREEEIKARNLVLREGPAALKDRSFKRTLDRLNRGVSLAQLEQLARRIPAVGDAREIVSRFLDVAIDQGVAVPITVDDDSQVVRAYRHGEDVRSVETDWCLYGRMLASLAQAWGQAELPRSVVESALCMFLRLGVKRGLFEPWHLRLGATGTAGIRYGTAGTQLRIESSSMIGNASGQSIVDLLVSGEILRRSRRSHSYRIGEVPTASAATQAQVRGAERIGWVLGRLLADGPGSGIGLEEFKQLSCLASRVDALFSLAASVAAAANEITVVLAQNETGRGASGRRWKHGRALETVDGGVVHYRGFLHRAVPRLVQRIADQLTDQLYRHEWGEISEQLIGGEPEEISSDVESLMHDLGAWLLHAALALRLAEATGPAGRRRARADDHQMHDRMAALRTELATLISSLPPSSSLRSHTVLVSDLDGLAAGDDAVFSMAVAELRALVLSAPIMVDEAQTRATAYGGLRAITQFSALLYIHVSRSGTGESTVIERDITVRIAEYCTAAARDGAIIHLVPGEREDLGLAVVGSGDGSAVWLGRLAVDLCEHVDGNLCTVALIPSLPRAERLVHGDGSASYCGTGFWHRVEALCSLATSLRGHQLIVLEPEAVGSDRHARGLLWPDGTYQPLNLPTDRWSTPIRWSAVTADLDTPSGEIAGADIGVITILSEETRAVLDVLRKACSWTQTRRHQGRTYYEARLYARRRTVRVVTTQTLDRGQRSVVVAFEQLQRRYQPKVVVLVGIAGAIHNEVSLGDVVIAHNVIYYDMRKETESTIVRRGQSIPVSAWIRHATNDFFVQHGEPYLASIDADGEQRQYKIVAGPIGSGEAVIAYRQSDVRNYLLQFNDKTMALETEAGGLAQAVYEEADSHPWLQGWLAVRGISDHADAAKDDTYHDVAARHAAETFMLLVPFLSDHEEDGHVVPDQRSGRASRRV